MATSHAFKTNQYAPQKCLSHASAIAISHLIFIDKKLSGWACYLFGNGEGSVARRAKKTLQQAAAPRIYTLNLVNKLFKSTASRDNSCAEALV